MSMRIGPAMTKNALWRLARVQSRVVAERRTRAAQRRQVAAFDYLATRQANARLLPAEELKVSRLLGALATAEAPAPSTSPAATARRKRDSLLRSSDWTQAADFPYGQATQAAWAAYRQALREVPQQAGFPSTIEWPSAPV